MLLAYKQLLLVVFTGIVLLSFQESQAENIFLNQENNVSTGKIIIDGVVIGSQNQTIVKGSGKHAEEKRALPSFKNIKVTGGVDIIYSQNSVTSAKITGDDNIIPLIETHVDGETLNIAPKKSYSTQLPVSLQITSPHLHTVFLDGSGKLTISNINSPQLSIRISGSSEVIASGSVNNLDIELSGAGDIDTRTLNANNVTVNIIGSGALQITAHKKLTATIMGSGDIRYFGSPGIIEKNITGAGDVAPGE